MLHLQNLLHIIRDGIYEGGDHGRVNELQEGRAVLVVQDSLELLVAWVSSMTPH